MYFVWFLAAAGVVLLWMLLKRLVFRSAEKRNLSPFQQSRPVPDLSGPQDPAERDRTRAALMNIAQGPSDESRRKPGTIPGSDPFPVQHKPSAFPAAAQATGFSSILNAAGEHTRDSVGTATIPLRTSGRNRLSTWENRKLFGEFSGILNESAVTLPMPAPEELPIQNDDLVFGSLTPSIAQLLPESAARREVQRRNLIGAGYHSRASWLNLTAIRFALAFTALVVAGFWLLMAPPQLEPWLLGTVVMAPLLMWAVPPLYVAWKAADRVVDIERGLPDVLDMMNMGVSQGLTVPQSLNRISREIATGHPALAEELRIVNQQAEVGNLPQALRNFAQRIDSPEVSSFTSLLVQSETTGTSISRALTEYSDSIRASLKERADARANAASFKMLFPVALCLLPSVFLFLLGPAIVQMSDFFANQGQQLQQNRRDAIRSLDQQPQLDFDRLNAGQFAQPL